MGRPRYTEFRGIAGRGIAGPHCTTSFGEITLSPSQARARTRNDADMLDGDAGMLNQIYRCHDGEYNNNQLGLFYSSRTLRVKNND